MTAARKQTAVAVALLGLVAWSTAHLTLALRYGTDPWSLFGWGMYATPKPVVQLDLGELGPSGAGMPWPPEVRAAAERYRDRRRVFGRLAPSDALGALALAARPELAGVAVRVRRLTLDPRSARFGVDEELRRYLRSPAGR